MARVRMDGQIREQYEIEKELATRLRTASREERTRLYPIVYDEFHRWMRCNPGHSADKTGRVEKEVMRQIRFLRRFLNTNLVFAEIGPGDCSLSLEVAKFVKVVYAVEASKEIETQQNYRQNFTLVISDGRSIPLQRHSVHIVYSHQFIEHLHPDDAMEHIRNVYEILAPGGVYACLTPNRLNGPHDISKYFDPIASGLHIKEYSNVELGNIFVKCGFSKIRIYIGVKGFYVGLPLFVIRLVETSFVKLPIPIRNRIKHSLAFRVLLGIRLVARK
jgi:SAM-dependent methyltransferase